jgi:hypothetical protein
MANTKVQSEQIEDGSITADKIADGAIVATELADNAVTTAKINADAVTGAKIADDAINSEHYTDGSIDTAHIADSQITVAKMAANSVDSDQYVDGSIDTVHIGDAQVTTAKITDGNISTAKIADNAVTSAKIDTNIAIAGTLASTGVLTANAGVVVDNITIDGTEIDLSSGDLTLDVAGDINLDADGGDIYFLDGGTYFGQISNVSSDLIIKSSINDKDILLQGVDNGSQITALTLDMSDAGTAIFNNKLFLGDNASHTDDFLQIETPASGGGHGIQIRRNDSNTDQGIGRILFGNNTDTDLVQIHAKTDGANDNGALIFSTQPDGGSLTERMRINHDGNVGIGTTSPSALLHLANAGPSIKLEDTDNNSDYEIKNGNGTFRIIDTTNSTDRVNILSSGNVGIGTTSPNAVLTTDPESGNFSSTYNNYDGVGLFIRGNGTSGNGNYGPALVFGSCDSDTANQDHKHSAISVVQTDTDPNQTGLAFWTHPSATSTDALSESMRITSGGDVCIGGTNDVHTSADIGTTLHILSETSGTDVSLHLHPDVGEYSLYAYNGYLAILDHTANTERMRIDSSGRVLIGQGSNIAHANLDDLQVGNGSSSNGITVYSGASEYGSVSFADGNSGTAQYSGLIEYYHNDDSMRLYTGGTERMRILSTGQVSFGTSSPLAGSRIFTLASASTPYGLTTQNDATTGTMFVMVFHSNGASNIGSITTTNTATAFNTSSDYRLKENIQPLENGLERLNNLKPVKFDWKEDGTSSEGFIAHEAQEVFSDAVSGEKDGEEMQGMDYGRITPLLVKAIQEQQEEIEQLKSEIEALKS